MVAISLLTACVLGTTRFYTPRASQARITLEEMRARADAMLAVECPRVVHGKNSVFAATDIMIDVDSTGAVQRAEIDRGSGDATLDDVFGALAAQLQLQPPPARQPSAAAAAAAAQSDQPQPAPLPTPLDRRHLVVSYACASDAGSVALELQKGGT
ncbi:MAG TPA: hypothetical protein VFK04_21825 [Gemmatimonadaceae bacterium]|nr:hypothetical protein [Gemmatimonadaceae bacterium]